MAIEIVDLPILLIVIFHSYVKLQKGIKYPIWENYNNSLTWKVRLTWGCFPLLTTIIVRENSSDVL